LGELASSEIHEIPPLSRTEEKKDRHTYLSLFLRTHHQSSIELPCSLGFLDHGAQTKAAKFESRSRKRPP
jgi:hypothetical protein